MSCSSTFSHLFGNFPLTPTGNSAAGRCNQQWLIRGQWICWKPTWGSPWFVLAQLSAAVRTTRVHTTIMQQEHRVLPSTGDLLQSPAAEHMTAPRLKHGVPLHADTQLSILCISPTQHVGEGRGDGAPIWRGGESDGQMEEDRKCSGLRAAPLSPLHVSSNPERNRKQGNYVVFLHQQEHILITVLHVWTPDVCQNKVSMGLEVGLWLCVRTM